MLVDSDCWDLLSSILGEKFDRFDRLFVSALCTVQATWSYTCTLAVSSCSEVRELSTNARFPDSRRSQLDFTVTNVLRSNASDIDLPACFSEVSVPHRLHNLYFVHSREQRPQALWTDLSTAVPNLVDSWKSNTLKHISVSIPVNLKCHTVDHVLQCESKNPPPWGYLIFFHFSKTVKNF